MNTLTSLSFVAALGSGLNAGFFYAFSICVMRALARLPPSQGVAAMQSINVVVINPWFLSLFVGLLVPCLWLSVNACLHLRAPGAGLRLAGGLAYALGCFGVTMLCNVPRNDAMAALSLDSPELAVRWAEYLSSWTAWNHVRALASGAAAALFTLSLRA